MFSKKKCPHCNEKINKENNFCSNCGTRLTNNENYGMLGKNDFIERPKKSSNNFFGNINDKMVEKMLGGAIKMFEKEMQKSITNTPKTKMRIMINGKEINTNPEQKPTKKRKIELPKKVLKGFSELIQKEPKTNIKRLGDLIFYEIELPNVKSIRDISINQLESSIEIKAKSEKEAYVKLIPISLPILNYEFLKEKLTLELSGKN